MKAFLTQEHSVHTRFWNDCEPCSMLWEISALGLLEPVEKSTVKLKRTGAKFLASAFSNSIQMPFILIFSDSTKVPCNQNQSLCSFYAGRYLSVIVKIWTSFRWPPELWSLQAAAAAFHWFQALITSSLLVYLASLCIRELFGKNILASMAYPWKNVLSVAAFKRVSFSCISEGLNLGENKNISCI